MTCEWFGVCGGCRLPLSYNDQLSTKKAIYFETLAGLSLPEPEIFTSPESHFRNRGEFRVWHEESGGLALAMYKPHGKGVLSVSRCPVTHRRFDAHIQEMLNFMTDSPLSAGRLFQLDYLANTDGSEMVMTLIYHKPMAEGWDEAASEFCERFGVSLIGRSKGIKKIVGQDYVTERVEALGRTWRYKQIEGSFTQPNGYANRAMINWALKHTPQTKGDFLELYCGNGNFTLPLSTRFEQTVAIEISKSSLAAAGENAAANGIENIFFARMGAEEFAQAFDRVRPFNRLSDLDLDSLNFQAALVDPPRAGLDPDSLALAGRMPKMIYVSCNPKTLARDLRLLEKTHTVKALALFDQFPYTPHLESAVVLERKQ